MRAVALVTVLTALLLSQVGCSSYPLTTDYDLDYDFAALERFAIKTERHQPESSDYVSPLALDRLRNSLQFELGKFYLQDIHQPDFWVQYHVVVEDKVSVRQYDDYYGYQHSYSRWHGAYPYRAPTTRTEVNEYQQGTVVVDMIDAKTNKAIWRGVVTGKVKERDNPQDSEQAIRELVEKMLEDFPPDKTAAQ